MPLIRAAAPSPEPAARDAAAPDATGMLLRRLSADDAEDRRRAARALAADPDAAAALAGRLAVEPAPHVREALFSSLADIGGPGVAGLVAPLLRNDDAALRGGAVETLKRLDAAAAAVLDALLDDADPDIRLLAIEVTRSWPSARAAPRLLRILAHDAHVNVCAAAVDVATEVGDGALLAALAALPDRFPDQPFLRFAVTVARARISAADARDTPARDAG